MQNGPARLRVRSRIVMPCSGPLTESCAPVGVAESIGSAFNAVLGKVGLYSRVRRMVRLDKAGSSASLY